MDDHEKLAECVRLALYGAGKTRIKLGNVTFWFAKGVMRYSLPDNQWDKATILADMKEHMAKGFERIRTVLHNI
jgi:hypothetical protein